MPEPHQIEMFPYRLTLPEARQLLREIGWHEDMTNAEVIAAAERLPPHRAVLLADACQICGEAVQAHRDAFARECRERFGERWDNGAD